MGIKGDVVFDREVWYILIFSGITGDCFHGITGQARLYGALIWIAK